MSAARLAGKVLVVIGGTSGIGLSAARAFVAEGAQVVVVGLPDEAAASARRDLDDAARVVTGDAREPVTAPAAITAALREFGGFHGLYHVAGGSGRRFGDGALHEISDAGWEETLRLNLTAAFYSNRAAVRQFLQQGTGGAVLNLASVLAYSPSPQHFATQAYATAKAGLVALTRSAAAQYAGRDIRFNALAPGLIATPMSRRAQGDAAIMDFIRAKQPLDGGRIGQPADLDSAAVFFLANESRFVTGQILAVDGGWSVTEGQTGSPEQP